MAKKSQGSRKTSEQNSNTAPKPITSKSWSSGKCCPAPSGRIPLELAATRDAAADLMPDHAEKTPTAHQLLVVQNWITALKSTSAWK